MLLQRQQEHRRKPISRVHDIALPVGQGGQREEGSVDERVAVDQHEPLFLFGLRHHQSLVTREPNKLSVCEKPDGKIGSNSGWPNSSRCRSTPSVYTCPAG